MASPSPPLTYNVAELSVEQFVGYYPSIALASVALALYVLAAIVVTSIAYRYQGLSCYMNYLVSFTGLLEAGGYAALIYITAQTGKANLYPGYVVMQVLIVLSPNLLQAADYCTLGKILVRGNLSNKSRFLKPKVIASIFVSADVLALLVQALGISLWASSKGSGTPNPKQISIGSYITVGGLAFQLFAFLFFLILVIWTHRHKENAMRGKPEFAPLFGCLYLTIVFITIRNIFRFAEFTQNAILSTPPPPDAYILSEQEVLFYTLDTLPILIAFAVFIIFHPSRLLFGTKQNSQSTDAGV